jgi:transcriptional regulator with XRE-family HTH domain
MVLRVNPTPPSGDQIREAREAANLTQEELAQRFGVSARTIQYWEAGKDARPKHRRAILEFLSEFDEVAA